MRWLAALLLIASTAHAKCVNVPLCFPPYSPPVDGLIFYEDNVPRFEWATTCLPKVGIGCAPGQAFCGCLGLPFWAPRGAYRTSAWYCSANESAALSFTVTRDGIESSRSVVMQDDGTHGWPTPCWLDLNVPAPPLHIKDLKSPSEKLVDLGKICLGDAACAQLVMDACTNIPACAAQLAPRLKSDFDADDTISPQDAGWWAMTLRGVVR